MRQNVMTSCVSSLGLGTGHSYEFENRKTKRTQLGKQNKQNKHQNQLARWTRTNSNSTRLPQARRLPLLHFICSSQIIFIPICFNSDVLECPKKKNHEALVLLKKCRLIYDRYQPVNIWIKQSFLSCWMLCQNLLKKGKQTQLSHQSFRCFGWTAACCNEE